jgi:atlastin
MENPLKNTKNWMGDSKEPLKGFSWKAGRHRDTVGILMWSDIFLHTTENGEKLAIILMDTQGLFDNETTHDDNTKIFTLNTLISSMQIMNLKERIQEDQLQYLQVSLRSFFYCLSPIKTHFILIACC